MHTTREYKQYSSNSLDVFGIGQIVCDITYKFDSDEEVKKALDVISPGHDFEEVMYDTIFQERGNTQISTCHPPIITAGGAVANTVVFTSMLGLSTTFVTDYGHDPEAALCMSYLNLNDVGIPNAPKDTSYTSKCVIMIHPNGDHTIVAMKGTKNVTGDDIELELVKKHKMLLLEGFVLNRQSLDCVLFNLFCEAKQAGVKNILTLSDPRLLTKQQYEYAKLLPLSDYLIGNLSQIQALYGIHLSLDEIATRALQHVSILVVTMGGDGVFVAFKDNSVVVTRRFNTLHTKQVVNTLGAGDAFAAGFLYGQLKNFSIEDSVYIGNKCATHIIERMDTKPSAEFLTQIKQEAHKLHITQ